jgi:hypothetical protein
MRYYVEHDQFTFHLIYVNYIMSDKYQRNLINLNQQWIK